MKFNWPPTHGKRRRHAVEAKNLTYQPLALQLFETISFIDIPKLGRRGTDLIVPHFHFRKPRSPIGIGIGIGIERTHLLTDWFLKYGAPPDQFLPAYLQMKGGMHLPMDRRPSHLSLSMPVRLNNCLGGRLDAFPQELQAKFEGRLNRGCPHAGPLSRMMYPSGENPLDHR